MKQFLFPLLLLIEVLLPAVCNAQVCKISGTNGDTIEVFASNYNDGKIEITLSSDSQVAANVTVSISVVYKNKFNQSETRTYTSKALAKPSQSTIVNIQIAKEITKNNLTYEYQSFSVDSVTGTKCL